MARAAAEALGGAIVAGMVTGQEDGGDEFSRDRPPSTWRFFPSSHPLPDAASEAAGRQALQLAADVRGEDDLLLVCLSGGASAMLAVPAPGLTLEDKRSANAALLRAGLDIGAMNTVRRHLSAIKGGQLAAAAFQSITLAISDVTVPVEDDPLTIGSGPTVGDSTNFSDALAGIDRAGLAVSMPASVMAHLRAGAAGLVAGPVRPDDLRLRRAAYWIVGSRRDGMLAAAETARHIGYTVHVHQPPIGGEARQGPEIIFGAVRQDWARPACVIASGETTVRVTGAGRGGRNQELAVAALEWLDRLSPAALASIGTDGVDGPTDAAGGMVDSSMWTALGPAARATCAASLDNNDTYQLLERLGALVKTGPTGTNVGDLQVLVLG
jgi:glycerate-2-kinase